MPYLFLRWPLEGVNCPANFQIFRTTVGTGTGTLVYCAENLTGRTSSASVHNGALTGPRVNLAGISSTRIAGPSGASGGASGGTYVVVTGDSLWKIAWRLHLPGGWVPLYKANSDIVTDPALIYPGQRLHLQR